METIHVNIHIRAPAEKVWSLFSDHQGYTFIRRVSEARLLEPGREERNGLGAVRRIRILGVTFLEDIVGFDPPRRLEYRVRECTLPIRHEIGRLDFASRGDGTDINWVSRFEVPVPIVGPIFAAACRRVFSRVFQGALEEARLRLEEP
ncbi:MAG: SRPBCC family protein [bacterium]